MQVEFFEPKLEQGIVQEILQWSKDVLETNSSFFGGLSSCSYAKKALADHKVSIMFKYEPSFQVLYTSISQFDDNFELNIIVDINYEQDPESFHEHIHNLNKCIADGMFIDRDVWLIGFHPDDEPKDFVEQEYAMIFVQRLSKLQENTDKLAKRGYNIKY